MADTTFTWYGHSCFELRTPGGKVVLFDPWFSNPTSPKKVSAVDRCDVLLVSHGHFDHLGSPPRQVLDADALTVARATNPVCTSSAWGSTRCWSAATPRSWA